jgi:hypothetical protein
MSRGIFGIRPKLMPFVADVKQYIRDTVNEEMEKEVLLSGYLNSPETYFKTLQTATDGLVEQIAVFVESIVTSKEFLDLFTYKAAEELGGSAFNNDKAELIKLLFSMIDGIIKRDLKYNIPQMIHDKMRITK